MISIGVRWPARRTPNFRDEEPGLVSRAPRVSRNRRCHPPNGGTQLPPLSRPIPRPSTPSAAGSHLVRRPLRPPCRGGRHDHPFPHELRTRDPPIRRRISAAFDPRNHQRDRRGQHRHRPGRAHHGAADRRNSRSPRHLSDLIRVDEPALRHAVALARVRTLAKRFHRDVARARAEGGLGSDFIFGAQRQGGQA